MRLALLPLLLASALLAPAQRINPPNNGGGGPTTFSFPSIFSGCNIAVTPPGTLTCVYATGLTANQVFATNSSGAVGLYAPSSIGLGNVTGPGSAVSGDLPSFSDTTGKVIGDSNVAAANVLVNGGALGTPSSGVGTNLTALNATNLSSGTLPAGRFPALTGDVTNSAGSLATTVGKINGVAVPTDGNITVSTGAGGLATSSIAASNVALLNAANVFTNSAGQSATTFTSLGTTATDSGNLGSELTSSGTTTSTGWTGSYNSYTNGASNTTGLTYAPTIASGSRYQVVITVSGYSAGSISITFGGLNLTGMSSNSTQTIGPKTTSTAGLVITPTSTFVGTVTASIKLISAISTFAFVGKDSTGANSYIQTQTLASLNNYFAGGGGTYNTTGGQNSAQGTNALFNNTTGSLNSAQGYQALFNNTTGSFNSAQGYEALFNNTTGNYNSAQGYEALFNNTTGGYNSAQGVNALYSNTTGNYNSAQGVDALYSNTTGSYNSAQGVNTLYSNTTGGSNSAVGYQAGYGTSSINANTTGGNNTFIGYEAAPGSSTQQNYLTVIGASATATCSNCISLGRSGSDSIQNGGGTWTISAAGNQTVQSIRGISSAPTVAISGTGTCTLGTPSTGANNLTGRIPVTGACTSATLTITYSGTPGYPNGSNCGPIQDITSGQISPMVTGTTTAATFSLVTVANSDVLAYNSCMGY